MSGPWVWHSAQCDYYSLSSDSLPSWSLSSNPAFHTCGTTIPDQREWISWSCQPPKRETSYISYHFSGFPNQMAPCVPCTKPECNLNSWSRTLCNVWMHGVVVVESRNKSMAVVMQDVYRLLSIKKLNTTAYHPQCGSMMERLNRILKTMLWKHACCNLWSSVGRVFGWCVMGVLEHLT